MRPMQIAALSLLATWLTACIASGTTASGEPAASMPAELLGIWRIDAIVPTGNVQGPSLSQQRSLIGTSIVYRNDALSACGSTVPVESVETRQVTSTRFRDGTGASLEALGIEQGRVEEVVINHGQSGTCFEVFPLPAQRVYLVGTKHALVPFEGSLYRADKLP